MSADGADAENSAEDEDEESEPADDEKMSADGADAENSAEGKEKKAESGDEDQNEESEPADDEDQNEESDSADDEKSPDNGDCSGEEENAGAPFDDALNNIAPYNGQSHRDKLKTMAKKPAGVSRQLKKLKTTAKKPAGIAESACGDAAAQTNRTRTPRTQTPRTQTLQSQSGGRKRSASSPAGSSAKKSASSSAGSPAKKSASAGSPAKESASSPAGLPAKQPAWKGPYSAANQPKKHLTLKDTHKFYKIAFLGEPRGISQYDDTRAQVRYLTQRGGNLCQIRFAGSLVQITERMAGENFLNCSEIMAHAANLGHSATQVDKIKQQLLKCCK